VSNSLLRVAIEEAHAGLSEGAIPIAAALAQARPPVKKSIHLDAVFANDGKGRQEMGSPEKQPNLFAKIHKF
jgi:hypothetical protein